MKPAVYSFLVTLMLVLSGCSGVVPSAEPTPDPAPCSATPPAESPSLNSSLRKSLPEKPAMLDESSAREFAVQYEEAALWNNRYRSDMESLIIEVRDAEVTEKRGGYEVVMDVQLNARHTDNSAGSDGWSTVYIISDSAVQRAQGYSGAPPTDETGQTVVCW